MRCNFEITQLVEFSGEFGVLDVHNAYDLDTVTASEGRAVLRFLGNSHLIAGKPLAFDVIFSGVTLFEKLGLPARLPDVHIEELGFLSPENRDYQWVFDRGRPAAGDHLALRWQVEAEEGVLRIAAGKAEVRISLDRKQS